MKYKRISGKVIQIDTEKKNVAIGTDEFYYVEAVEKDLIDAIENDVEINVLVEETEKSNKITKITKLSD